MNTNNVSTRVLWPDIGRTFAIALMIFFHTCYDLQNFHYIELDLETPFWFWLPRFIVFLFLIVSGASLALSKNQKKEMGFWKKRFLKLGISMIAVSFITYLLFPNNWIYFGTLHCLFFSNLAGVFLYPYKQTRRLIILLTPISWWLLDLTWASLSLIPIVSMDFIPFYPWFAVFLLGMELGERSHSSSGQYPINRYLLWPSRHSLSIYLIHQPIIFGLLWFFS